MAFGLRICLVSLLTFAVWASSSSVGLGQTMMPAAPAASGSPVSSSTAARNTLATYTARGQIVRPDGSPCAAAIVAFEQVTPNVNVNVAGLTHDDTVHTETDSDGKFACDIRLIPRNVGYLVMCVRAAGYG